MGALIGLLGAAGGAAGASGAAAAAPLASAAGTASIMPAIGQIVGGPAVGAAVGTGTVLAPTAAAAPSFGQVLGQFGTNLLKSKLKQRVEASPIGSTLLQTTPFGAKLGLGKEEDSLTSLIQSLLGGN